VVAREEFIVLVEEHSPHAGHTAEPPARLFDLNGTKGTAPTASIAVRFAFDRYALSADTSVTANRCAVEARSCGNSGES
jgi:hypothetical protein